MASRPIRVAFEGCGHGTLHAIYASVAESARARGWDDGVVDLLIIGGDFQAVRNAADLTVMSCPAKYRQIGDFADYYSGRRVAPFLTLFVGGNHEASSHLNELFHGGWVAPGIYYLGAAGVVRLQGGLRVAGLSGIWKGFDYRRPHCERLPFGEDDVKSCYHVREVDVRRLLMLRSQVDIGLSHDWPRGIELLGNSRALFRCKPLFEQDSIDGRLGSPAAEWVMDRLRPQYWFSAHLHCKFTAIKTYEGGDGEEGAEESSKAVGDNNNPDEIDLDLEAEDGADTAPTANPDEIGLDLDEAETAAPAPTTTTTTTTTTASTTTNPNEISLDGDDSTQPTKPAAIAVPEDLRAQLPASFTRPREPPGPKKNPGQPAPPGVTNKHVRFLALDKCLPGRHFIQLMEITPLNPEPTSTPPSPSSRNKYPYPLRLEYDPEWLAITRALSPLVLTRPGDPGAQVPPDQGEAHYAPLVDEARAWVERNVVATGKLTVPENFEVTAPAYQPGEPEQVPEQPVEWTNPQTAAFCEMLGIENLWDATEEERERRRANGPPAGAIGRGGGGWRGGRGGHGGRGGRGGGGGGGGRGWGGRGRGGHGRRH